MQQPKKFKYILNSPLGGDFELKYAPIGWEENTIQWARSEIYYGLVRNFSFPIKFVKDGASILRKALYSEGFNANVFLKILMLNSNTWEYNEVYRGDIDFSTAEDDLTSFSVNISDNGIEAYIKGNENIRYEIPIIPSEAVKVNLVSIPSTGNANMAITMLQDKAIVIPNMNLGASNVDENHATVKTVVQAGYNEDINLSTNTNWFLKAERYLESVVVSGSMSIERLTSEPFVVQFILIDSSSRELGWERAITNQSPVFSEFTINTNFYLPEGGKVFIVSKVTYWGGAGRNPLKITAGKINISYQRALEHSTAYAYRPLTLFKKLAEKMTGSVSTNVQSFTLENEWSNLLITSGNSIRNLPNPSIKTSFRDFFKSLDSLICLGFSVIDGVPTIEDRDYFYQRALETSNVGEVKDCVIEPADQFIYNSVKVGYPDKDYEREDGLEEYNSFQEYSSNLKRFPKKYDIVSVYRADRFGVEEIRENQDQKNLEKKDTKQDNDVFLLFTKHTGTGGAYDLETGIDYHTINGVSSIMSAYNLEITPKRNLLRHMKFLSSGLFQSDQKFLNFDSAEKNKMLATRKTLEDDLIEERSAAVYEGIPMFLPYIAKFTAKLDFSKLNDFNSKPNGFIRFKAFGKEFAGYILETSLDLTKNSAQEYKVLLTDFSSLLNLTR